MAFPEETTVHELFHAVQDAVGTYDYDAGAWYHEATAVWVEAEVYPQSTTYAGFLPGYAYLPELPLNHFDYPDTGTLEEYHQYGAFVFARYLSEVVDEPDFIRRTWVEANPGARPLDVIDQLLQADHGLTAWEAFQDFAIRNTTWDYEHGEIYEAAYDSWEGWWPSNRPTHTVLHSTDGWVEIGDDEAPWTYGVNYVRVDQLSDPFTLTFEHELPGKAWFVATVDRDGTTRSLDVSALNDGAEVSGLDDGWLVIGVEQGLVGTQPYGYRFQLVSTGNPDPRTTWEGPEEVRACGCAAAGSSAVGSVALALLIGLRRRRPPAPSRVDL